MYFTELIEYFQDCSLQSHVYNNANLSSYRFLTEEIDSYDYAYLYVGMASSLAKRTQPPANASLIIICDEMPNTAELSLNLNSFVLIDGNTELMELFQRIRKFFGSEKFLVQSNKILMKASQQGLSVQELLDLACGILGNPIMFVDVALCLICYSNGATEPDEPFWKETIEAGHMPQYYVKAVQSNFSDSNRTVILEWMPECAKHRIAFAKVFVCNTPVGYIKLLEYNRRFTSADLELMELLCRIVAIEMRSNAQMSEQQQFRKTDVFLLMLLNQKLHDEASIRDRMYLLNIQLRENLFVLCLESEEEMTFPEKNYYVKQVFQDILGTQLCTVYNQQVVFLLDTQKQPESYVAELRDRLTPHLEEHRLRAGISSVFYDLTCFAQSNQEASGTLKIMRKIPLERRFYGYSDLVVYHIIEASLQLHGLSAFRSAVLLKLAEDSKGKSYDLINTLDTYLNCNQDLSCSAKKLFIHYNTMKYRVNRISELTNFDFSDSMAVLHLQLCFAACRLLSPESVLPNGRFDEAALCRYLQKIEPRAAALGKGTLP